MNKKSRKERGEREKKKRDRKGRDETYVHIKMSDRSMEKRDKKKETDITEGELGDTKTSRNKIVHPRNRITVARVRKKIQCILSCDNRERSIIMNSCL